jgi:hypothetical protein
MLVNHLLLQELFPKCDGTDSDIIVRTLKAHNLEKQDRVGEIYATVCYFKTVMNTIVLELIRNFIRKDPSPSHDLALSHSRTFRKKIRPYF